MLWLQGEKFALQELPFHTCCYDLAPGHRIALGLSMHDYLYQAPSTDANLSVAVSYAVSYESGTEPMLFLPLVLANATAQRAGAAPAEAAKG